MKRIVVGLMVGLMVAGVAVAQVDTNAAAKNALAQEAMGAGLDLMKKGDLKGARAAFDKLIVDHPGAYVTTLAKAESLGAYMLYLQRDDAAAKTAYEKVTAKYAGNPQAGVVPYECFMHLAAIAERGNDWAGARAAYEKAKTALPAIARHEEHIGNAQKKLIRVMKIQGKAKDVTKACMAFVEQHARDFDASNPQGIIQTSFDEIDPRLVTDTEYKAFLVNAVKSVRAVETNAAFLGRLKSELGKME